MLMTQAPHQEGQIQHPSRPQPSRPQPPRPQPSPAPPASDPPVPLEQAPPSRHADVVGDIMMHSRPKGAERAGATPHVRAEVKQSRLVTRQSVPDSSSPKTRSKSKVKSKSSTTTMLL
eukprot:764298-Hanusia_phi.AAC.6